MPELSNREIIAIGLFSVDIFLFWFTFWYLRRHKSNRLHILKGLAFFILFLGAALIKEDIHSWVGITADDSIAVFAIDALVWGSFTFLAMRVIHTFLWREMLTKDGELLVPKILVHMTDLFIILVVLIFFVHLVLEKDITGLATGTAGLLVGIGYLAKTPFESLFAGLSFSLSPMFKKGDRVSITVVGTKEVMGFVQDMGWLQVTVKTKEGCLAHVQNLLVEKAIIVNFSQPTPQPCFMLEVTLEYEFPVSRGYQIIEDALEELKGSVDNYTINAENFTRFGINYLIRFWTNEKQEYHLVSHAIHSAIYYKVQKELNSDFGYDKFGSMNAAKVLDKQASIHQLAAKVKGLTGSERAEILRRVEIFESLDEQEIMQLAEACIPCAFGPPEKVIRQGDEGDSMFVIVSGHVEIFIKTQSNEIVHIAAAGPGAFFGEMALLTGEQRGASVQAIDDVALLEIPKEGLKEVLKKNPSLAGKIAAAVAQRQAENEASVDAVEKIASSKADGNRTRSDAIRIAVLHFFGLDTKV